jgi:hypothetical protein
MKWPQEVSADFDVPTPVDTLLREFFQHEQPRSWPALPLPAAPSSSAHRRKKSHLALAASVLFLVGSIATAWTVMNADPPRAPLSSAPGVSPSARGEDAQGRPKPAATSRNPLEEGKPMKWPRD